jgi:hypothetical protein
LHRAELESSKQDTLPPTDVQRRQLEQQRRLIQSYYLRFQKLTIALREETATEPLRPRVPPTSGDTSTYMMRAEQKATRQQVKEALAEVRRFVQGKRWTHVDRGGTSPIRVNRFSPHFSYSNRRLFNYGARRSI